MFLHKNFSRSAPLYWRSLKLKVRSSNKWDESYRRIGCSRKAL